MSIDRVVANASPIIVFYKSNLVHVIEQLCTEFVVPDAVWQEITEAGLWLSE